MTLVKWNQNKLLNQWEQEINELFNTFNFSLVKPEQEQEGVSWKPNAEFKETDECYLINVELPGIAKDDVSIELEKDVLIIKGEKKEMKKEEDKGNYLSERSYGFFSRSFRIPGAVTVDAIKAEYNDGILGLTLPKAEEEKSKSIEIK